MAMITKDQLMQFLEQANDMQFSYGEHDCCMFAARCVEMLTGKHPNPHLNYTTKSEAYALLDEFGGMAGLWDAHMPRRPLDQIAVGDVVMVDTPEGHAVGIAAGEMSMFAGVRGIRVLPTSSAIAAWCTTCLP